jgi:pyruvate/2-oxoacid:ferredoxin oxidoreductase beta subunit
MKITKSQLRKIIKEEVSKALLEEEGPSFMEVYTQALAVEDPEERKELLQLAYSIADSDNEVDKFLNQLKSDGLEDDHKFFSKEGDLEMSRHVNQPGKFYATAKQKRKDQARAEARADRLRKQGKIT